jgi:hypothetical protein
LFASLATNFDSQVSQESREIFGSKLRVLLLARISKSDSRVNSNFEESRKSKPNHHVNAQYMVAKWRFQFFAKYDNHFLLDVIIAIIATFFALLHISHKRQLPLFLIQNKSQ